MQRVQGEQKIVKIKRETKANVVKTSHLDRLCSDMFRFLGSLLLLTDDPIEPV